MALKQVTRELGRIPQAFKQGKVKLAPQKMVKKYSQQVRAILWVLGHEEALVTDWSEFSDFPGAWRRKMVKEFGISMPPMRMKLWELAKQIREKG